MNLINNKLIRQRILEKYNSKCAYCGCNLTIDTLSIDHIEPKFRHYSDKELLSLNRIRGICSPQNFNPSCKSCNSSKGTFTIEKWRIEIELKHKRLLRDSSSYRLLFRYGLITINNSVKFYFERIQNG